MGKKGSRSISRLVKNSTIKRYKSNCDILINYGLTEDRLNLFFKRFPRAAKKKILNRVIGNRNKYTVVKIAEKNGIVVPTTKLSLKSTEQAKFLSKPFASQGGKNIHMATTCSAAGDKY